MNKKLIKKITIITLSCLFLITTISVILFGALKPSAKPFKGSNGQYVNQQVEIFDYVKPTKSSSVDIKELYRLDNSSTGAISKVKNPADGLIININSALDLYAFSQLCKIDTEFLTYSYQLLSNINYDDSLYAFEPIAWQNGRFFTGTFNGNGFEISNLDLVKISESSKNQFPDIHYFAMFSKLGSGAALTKLGLRDANIVINAAIPNLAVSSMVGYIAEGAQASYIFATDLRDPILDEAGITASGGYRISGLVYQNEGILSNAYTAYNSVSNYTVTDYIDFSEILTIDNVTTPASNLFFYNSSIESYLEKGNGRDSYRIEYKAPISKIFEVSTHYGTYIDTLANLDTTVVNSDSNHQWYSKNSYSDLTGYLSDIITPISRGLNCSKDSSGIYHFNILNEQDFGYMFELMNHNAKFATDRMSYEIENNLNLDLINPSNYYYPRSIGATITGKEIQDPGVTMIDATKNVYPTIYNPILTNKVITEGLYAYGLFPWLSGSVSNLNIIIEEDKSPTINVDSASGNNSNIKAFGIVSGYVDGGSITNVNVLGNISFDSTIGKYFVGGAVGILSGMGSVDTLTVGGSITLNQSEVLNLSSPSGYMEGCSIGGAIGYVDRTYGAIADILSAATINAFANTSYDMAIGGVIGAGYIGSLNGIENKGSINVGTNSKASSFKSLYLSGGIGRLLGIKSQLFNIKNQGRIEVYLNTNSKAFISGILNADIITKSSAYLDQSSLKRNGNFYFEASTLSNAANVILHSKLTSDSGYTLGMNILSKNGFKSMVSGVSNLKYTRKYEAAKRDHDNNPQTPNQITSELMIVDIPEAFVVDMSIVNSFAGVINVINDDSHNTVELDTIYNLRDLSFEATSALANLDYLYSGVINGKFITLKDVTNEGNINIDFKNGASKNAGNKLIANGVFEQLSQDHVAYDIFNGGAININSTSTNINFDIYAQGIAYMNNAVLSDNSYNPLHNDFNKESLGSFNNVINNGDINVSSTSINLEDRVNISQARYINGNIYASGICNSNSGIISNTFNLGDVKVLLTLASDKGMYSSGIAYINSGDYAQIKDSSNNGIIRSINVGLIEATAYASGIISTNTTSINSKQVIAFTINYGEIYAFNSIENNSAIDTNEKTKAGGFIAYGLLNLVNTINYGNVYSTNTAGGMIGAFSLSASSSNATIANTLNYGIVKAINAYTNEQAGNVYAKISDILAKNEKYIYVGIPAGPKYQFTGALIGVADYANLANKITIRYLVNFYEGVLIVAQELHAPTSVDSNIVKTLYNVSPLNKFMGIEVTYAPLSSVSDEFGNIGVFAPEFGFRQAIEGKNLDNNYLTDKYIGDFFSFVGFEKINEVIFNNIGWGQIAYMDAAERFARDLKTIVKFLNLDEVKQATLLDEAINNPEWLEKCDDQILNNLLDNIINGNVDEASLKELLRFVLFDNNGHNIVSKALRSEIVDQIYKYLADSGKTSYEILNSLLYDEVLAKIVAEPNLEYKEISDEIRRIISNADNLDAIMDSYIEALRTYITTDPRPSTSLVDPLFDSKYESYYYKAKLDLLDVILSGYSEDQLINLLNIISNKNTDNRTKYLLYLNNNPDEISNIYTHVIASNSFNNQEYLRVMNEAFKRYGISSIIKEGTKQIDSQMMQRVNSVFDSVHKDAVTSITSFNKASVGDYVALWNLIKGNGAFKSYLNSILPQVTSAGNDPNGKEKKTGPGIYAKATEFNNTYQSNDSPSGVTNYFNGGDVEGKIRNDSDTDAIETRYIYTPDEAVSERTYFYGPYMDASIIVEQGAPVASKKIFYPGNVSENYNLEYDLYTIGTASTGGSNVRYVPFFASTTSEDLKRRGSTTDFPFYWSNFTYNKNGSGNSPTGQSSNQWVSTFILDNDYRDAVNYLVLDNRTPALAPTNDQNSRYIVNGYDFDFGMTKGSNGYSQTRNGQKERTTSNFTYDYYDNDVLVNSEPLNLATTQNQVMLNGVKHPYRGAYFTGHMSTSFITGIWYQQNIWEEKGGRGIIGAYLTAKNDSVSYFRGQGDFKNQRYVGVQTTQYISYFLDDILALDGRLTKPQEGHGKNAPSEDEKQIINEIMEAVLSTAEGRSTVVNAVAVAAEKNLGKPQHLALEILEKALQSTSFEEGFVKDITYDNQALNGLIYDANITLKNHLESLIATLNLSTKDEIKNSVVNNKDAFIKLLVETYDRAKKASNHATIPIGNLNDFVYKLINSNPDLSPDQIKVILDTVSDLDLDNIEGIYKRKIPINTSFSIYKIATDSWSYNEGTFGTYTKELVALNDNSQITFNTTNNKLRVVFKGTISVNGVSHTNNSMQEHIFDLTKQNCTLTATAGSSIYLIEAKTDGSLIGTTAYHNGLVTTTNNPQYSATNKEFTLRGNNNKKSISISNIPSGVTVKLSFTSSGTGQYTFYEDNKKTTFNNNMTLAANSTYKIEGAAKGEGTVRIQNLKITYTGNANGINYTITQPLAPSGNEIAGDIKIESTSYPNIEYQIGSGNRVAVNIPGTGKTLTGVVAAAVSFYTPSSSEVGDFSSVKNELVAKMETDYNALNLVAKSVFDSSLISLTSSNGSIANPKPSYLFVDATKNGNILVNGIDKAVTKGNTYVFSLDEAKSYIIGGTGFTNPRIMPKDAVLTRTVNNQNDVLSIGTKEIINFDYSALNGIFTTLGVAPAEFEQIYGVRADIDKVALRKADLVELVMTLFPTMKSGSQHPTNPNQWILFLPNTQIPEAQRIFQDTDLTNLATMIAKADYNTNTGSLAKMFDQYNDVEGLKGILLKLTNNERVLKEILVNIQAIAKQNNNKSILDLYKAAYLGDDFLKSIDTFNLRGSKLKTLLDLLSEEYRFIKITQLDPNDSSKVSESIDVDKFKSLMKRLGFNLETEGYGIYALSSSKGILNGSFIPDNVVLSTLDKMYDSNLHLTDMAMPSWRGGTLDNPNLKTPGSVNEAVLGSMKQLKKSISTTIFTLDLIDSKGTIHRSSESSIDLKNKTITYYVPTGYIASLGSNNSLNVYGSVSLANGATHTLKDPLQMQAEILDGITVVAEDITVISRYKIIFSEIAIDFTLDYSDGSTSKVVPSTGDRITLRVNSGNANKLPEGMDLTMFLKATAQGGVAVNNEDAFMVVNKENNGVVNSQGNAEIVLDINPSLKAGDYNIILDIFSLHGGMKHSVTLSKSASNLNSITSFIYDGKEMVSAFNSNNELETEIEFGRAFDYDELTNKDLSTFYLNNLEYSPGAICNINATKEIADNIMTYVVTYTITAEDGTVNTYIHRLRERTPFKSGERYATVYENGVAENNDRFFDNVTLDNNIIRKSFERGLEPQFSVKYSLSSFYLDDNLNISYDIAEGVNNVPGSAIIDIYSGMMITVTESSEPGDYEFKYIYSSKGMWSDSEYVREYIFPSLIITKNYSKDSSLKKISFIDTHEVLSSLATIMDPTTVYRPNVAESELDTYVDKQGVAHKEINYDSVTDGNRKINIEKGNIDYKSYTGYKDYFTIGTISNAALDSYNPTFKIEEHASIFRSTTLEKLKFYGMNQGSKPDMEVLTNHDTAFIYVPFISGSEEKIFLVQIENGEWTKVYYETFSGSDAEILAPVANLAGGVREFTDSSDGKVWRINPIAGKPTKDNTSLMADYIGTPQEGHFWYVSYVVFSEDYINKTGANDNLTYYHIGLIDQTNTVYFDIMLKAPKDIGLDSIFITLAYSNYDENGDKTTNQISGYVEDKTENPNDEIHTYYLKVDLQILPTGYYYFLVDLPVGYIVEARVTNNRPNRNDKPDLEPGAYLPPSSIVTQRVSVELSVLKDMASLQGSWGASIGDIGTRVASFVS